MRLMHWTEGESGARMGAMRYIASLLLFVASVAFAYWVELMWGELSSTAWFVIWATSGALGLICLFWKLLEKTIRLPLRPVLLFAIIGILSSILIYTRNTIVEKGVAQEEEELSENDKLVEFHPWR